MMSCTILFIVVSLLSASLATFIQKTKLQASDATAGDFFGRRVSISNNYLLVGAYYQDTGGSNSGAAYVFEEEDSGAWVQVQKLEASDKQVGDEFGFGVSISNNYLAIGAWHEDTGGAEAGAVYVFERDNEGIWREVQKLQSADKHPSDYFGRSVSISNDYLVIGAYGEDTGAVDAGAAFIFERNEAGVWEQVPKLQASDKQGSDYFGHSVSISNNYVVVGAHGEDTGGGDAGSAYIFERSAAGPWIQVKRLQASDKQGSDYFGHSVSIFNNYVVVGAYGEATGGTNAGAAYIFERGINNAWNQIQRLQASDKQASDYFGYTVSISDDYVVVGAHGENTGGTDAGSAYLFRKDQGGVWVQVQKLQASDRQASDYFGVDVCISAGNKIVIGAHCEDTGGAQAGAAYVFNEMITEDDNEIGIVRFKQNYKYMSYIVGEGLFMKHGPGIIVDSLFIKVDALNGAPNPNCYSFKSIHYPNYYIIHRLDDGDDTVDLWPIESDSFRDSGTWCYRYALNKDSNSVSLRSDDYDNYYMKVDENQAGKIVIAQNDNTITFAEDASWIIDFN